MWRTSSSAEALLSGESNAAGTPSKGHYTMITVHESARSESNR